jgi:NCAIR mutase (PurE)-related protein
MNKEEIKKIFSGIKNNKISVKDAVRKLEHLSYEDISFAKIDHHRCLRQGIPEVIFAKGKTERQVVDIAKAMHRKSKRFLITRATKKVYGLLKIKGSVFYPLSGIISFGEEKRKTGSILVLSAGTSDIQVAEEAAVTVSFLGSKVKTIYDVGVAGLHRLLDNRQCFDSARVIIVVAGMEGALPSVVGGLTDKPIIAVPTSVGYGTSLGGLTALFAMLNSCVPGIAVMNIDNGFGAGCLAHKINMLSEKS